MLGAIRDREPSFWPSLSFPAAAADRLEGVAVDGVAADPSVLDTDAEASYRDGVGHVEIVDGLSEGHKSCPTSMTPLAESARERERLAFLRRVQYVDPRTRRT